MKTKFYTRLFAVSAIFLIFAGVTAQQTELIIPIRAGEDDAEECSTKTEWFDAGGMSNISSDLELCWDDVNQAVGVLFRDVQIPKEATIDTAYIQFYAKEASDDDVNIMVAGVDSSNVKGIGSFNFAITSKATTEATVDWTPDIWYNGGDANVEQQTPSLISIVEEITANVHWVEGNNMMFVLTSKGTNADEGIRNPKSYDDDQYGPILHITFTGGTYSNKVIVDADSPRRLVYPNPTQGTIYIENPSMDKFSYDIYSISGKLVQRSQELTGASAQADLSTLNNGIYFINILSGDTSEAHKVVVNK